VLFFQPYQVEEVGQGLWGEVKRKRFEKGDEDVDELLIEVVEAVLYETRKKRVAQNVVYRTRKRDMIIDQWLYFSL
jgi:hypothetical protein